jgi:biotin operon repressor
MQINELLETVSTSKAALTKAQSDYDAAIAAVKSNDELLTILRDAGLDIKTPSNRGNAGVGRPIVKIRTLLKKADKQTAPFSELASALDMSVDTVKAAIQKKRDAFTIKGESVTLNKGS